MSDIGISPRVAASLAGVACAAFALTWTAAADAQQSTQPPSLALDRFNPAPVGDRFFAIPYPAGNGDADPHVGLLGDFAFEPLVLNEFADDGSDAAIVTAQHFLHFGAAFGLGERLNVNLDIPFKLAESGDGAVVGGRTLRHHGGAAVGDLRLGTRLTMYGEFDDPFQVALGLYLFLPTGDTPSFVSTGDLRTRPHLVFGGLIAERVLWSATTGVEVRNDDRYAGINQGVAVDWGGAVGFYLDENQRLQLGPELYMATSANEGEPENLNAELLLGFKGRPIDDIELGIAGGPGLTDAIGTPTARLLLSAAYTPKQIRDKDRDEDGIPDKVDACPDVPGIPSQDPAKNGCPPPGDKDGDGIIDPVDACPDVPGIASQDPAKNGCPPPGDRDGDSIIDEVDACPDVPGVASTDPKKNGCPSDRDEDGVIDAKDACPDVPGPEREDPATSGCPDRDEDGIMDAQDACPDEKGVPSTDPAKNGCPAKVIVTDKEIVILQKVEFDFNKATIKPVSDPLLDEVAQVMKDNPDILKIEIQGHTDDVGSDAHNKLLSQRRADAVREAMTKRGIEAGRLESKGYGEEVPLGPNDSEEARAKNRRVQFKILERKKK